VNSQIANKEKMCVCVHIGEKRGAGGGGQGYKVQRAIKNPKLKVTQTNPAFLRIQILMCLKDE
jgi:hypothetical protein